MTLSRRDFVKICSGTVAGFGISQMFHPEIHQALAATLTGERPPVLWLQGQACTGCSVTLLNYAHPSIADVLLKVISLEFHPTVMAAEGEQAYEYMLSIADKFKGNYIVVVEGAIPLAHDGKCCVIAESKHEEITIASAAKQLGANALATLAVGTCAAYGGIPAAKGNETKSMGVSDYYKQAGVATPVINVPGCPPHPDWIVGTIGLALQAVGTNTFDQLVKHGLDATGRPKAFFGRNTHMHCPHLPDFEAGKMSKTMTDKSGCRYQLGCKGPKSSCDSSERLWNNRTNWCVANATCIGCTSYNFPDGKSPFYVN